MNGDNGGRPSGRPPVYRRFVKRTPTEIAEPPPVRTKPIHFTGRGPGRYGVWEPGDPVGAVRRDEGSLLDWALVSWARRHVLEEVWDLTGGGDDGQA